MSTRFLKDSEIKGRTEKTTTWGAWESEALRGNVHIYLSFLVPLRYHSVLPLGFCCHWLWMMEIWGQWTLGLPVERTGGTRVIGKHLGLGPLTILPHHPVDPLLWQTHTSAPRRPGVRWWQTDRSPTKLWRSLSTCQQDLTPFTPCASTHTYTHVHTAHSYACMHTWGMLTSDLPRGSWQGARPEVFIPAIDERSRWPGESRQRPPCLPLNPVLPFIQDSS